MVALSPRFVLGLLVILGLVAVPSPSQAETQMEFVHSGFLATTADFSTPVTNDSTGCLTTEIQVRADDLHAMAKAGPGKPFSGTVSSGGMSIVQFNSCTSRITLYHECSTLDPEVVNISPSLGKATLAGPITCFDPYDFDFPHYEVQVNVTWTATGPVVRRFSHDRLTNDGEKSFAYINNEFRPAVATGTILLNGENLIPNASLSAVIESQRRKLHDLVICKPNGEPCESAQ